LELNSHILGRFHRFILPLLPLSLVVMGQRYEYLEESEPSLFPWFSETPAYTLKDSQEVFKGALEEVFKLLNDDDKLRLAYVLVSEHICLRLRNTPTAINMRGLTCDSLTRSILMKQSTCILFLTARARCVVKSRTIRM
jgi:hypothetical protein